MIKPLQAPEIATLDLEETRAEKLWKPIPILGWAIGHSLWLDRARPIVAKIDAQLAQRPESVFALWSDEPAKVAFVKEICELVAHHMDWSNARFIPDDPAAIVFWSPFDGLEYVEIAFEIEDRFRITLQDPEINFWFSRTLGEIVGDLWNRVQTKTNPAN